MASDAYYFTLATLFEIFDSKKLKEKTVFM